MTTEPTFPLDRAALREKLERSLGSPNSGGDPDATIRTDPPIGGMAAPFERGEEVIETSPSSYRLLDEVGRGGMGVVLCARQGTLQREVALKRVTASLQADDLVRQHFIAEAFVTAALQHPNIVPVHDLACTPEGELFMAMKLVRGTSWAEKLHPDGAPRDGCRGDELLKHLEILLSVCNAVGFAHSRGVVHCDLKPTNVMVGAFSEVLVMDWGIAVSFDAAGPRPGHRHRSDLSSTSGTPSYMAPELAEGRGEDIGPATDVYLLGAVLCEILTGAPPHGGETLLDVVQAAAAGKPPELPADVHVELQGLCRRALARELSERTPDVATFRTELRSYLAHRESIALTDAAIRRIEEAGVAVTADARFEALSEAIAGFSQARVLWDENPDARRGEESARDALAASARAARRLRRLLFAAGVVIVAGLSIGILLVRAEQRRTDAEAREKSRALDDVQRLADTKHLEDLVADASRLWPPHPRMATPLRAWRRRAEALLGRLPRHEATLADLKARALPWSDADRAADRERVEKRVEDLETLIRDIGGDLEADDNSELRNERLRGKRARFEDSLAAATAKLGVRTTYRFGRKALEWQYDLLDALIEDLVRFRDDEFGPWKSVERRLDGVGRIEAATILEPAAAWKRATAAVAADARFDGLDLAPVTGLIPLGADPRSGLQEFLHWQSHVGPVPERNADGAFGITADTGIILVLVPGGRFLMGAQRDESDAPGYDPLAGTSEWPPHEVSLDPFMIAKYELTQGQFKRATGREPAEYSPEFGDEDEPFDLRHPVENVTFWEARNVARSFGLRIPTEAQWEFACRAGTTTPWWTGESIESLRNRCNLADEGAKGRYPPGWEYQRGWDDGYGAHAPVGSYPPNPFGLHDVHGNVAEWCFDDYGRYANPVRPGTGERRVPNQDETVIRGGHYIDLADTTRSSARESSSPDNRALSTGVRLSLQLRD